MSAPLRELIQTDYHDLQSERTSVLLHMSWSWTRGMEGVVHIFIPSSSWLKSGTIRYRLRRGRVEAVVKSSEIVDSSRDTIVVFEARNQSTASQEHRIVNDRSSTILGKATSRRHSLETILENRSDRAEKKRKLFVHQEIHRDSMNNFNRDLWPVPCTNKVVGRHGRRQGRPP